MKSLSQLRKTLAEMQQIDELDKSTLKSYIGKATSDLKKQADDGGRHAATAGQLYNSGNYDRAAAMHLHNAKKSRAKADKREKGIQQAATKLEESHAWSLPMVLLLRRKTIRNFSDGTAVALYYNDRIDRYFSIPIREPHTLGKVDPTTDPIQVGEEFECESNFDHLQLIAEDLTAAPMRFADGSELSVDRETANRVLMMYTQLNESNKLKFLENIDSREAFDKIIAFIQK